MQGKGFAFVLTTKCATSIQSTYMYNLAHLPSHWHTKIKLTHRSRQKWWSRKVVVTSSMYKGCYITSLLSSRLQLLKCSDPNYTALCILLQAHAHLTIARLQKAKAGLTTNTVVCYPWLSLCRVTSGLHTIWRMIPTRHSSCTVLLYGQIRWLPHNVFPTTMNLIRV